MIPTLYFLRSSEQKIVTDILHYAFRLDEFGKRLDDFPHLSVYDKHYGFTNKDLGLYAISGHELSGAAWIRLFSNAENVSGYIDEFTPVLTVGVKPEYQSSGIGSIMLEQLLIEAGALYERISVAVVSASPAVRFYEKLGFVPLAGSDKKSLVDGSDILIMVRKLSGEEAVRPSEGYDPRRWMD